MDVEKTMEFILEQTAHIHALQAQAAEHLAKHDGDVAKINEIRRPGGNGHPQ